MNLFKENIKQKNLPKLLQSKLLIFYIKKIKIKSVYYLLFISYIFILINLLKYFSTNQKDTEN